MKCSCTSSNSKSCEGQLNPESLRKEAVVSSKISSKLQQKIENKKVQGIVEESLFTQVKSEVIAKGYMCISTKCPSKDTCLTFRCSEGHTFSSTEFATTGSISCPKCQKLLEHCIEYAKAHNG